MRAEPTRTFTISDMQKALGLAEPGDIGSVMNRLSKEDAGEVECVMRGKYRYRAKAAPETKKE